MSTKGIGNNEKKERGEGAASTKTSCGVKERSRAIYKDSKSNTLETILNSIDELTRETRLSEDEP